MTLLEHPVETRAPAHVPTWVLVLSTPDPDGAAPALCRETRAGDLVERDGADLVVLVGVPSADLDAVADRLLTVVERATGQPAAAGVCLLPAGLPRAEVLRRARLGVSVAWSCGGGRVVRHP